MLWVNWCQFAVALSNHDVKFCTDSSRSISTDETETQTHSHRGWTPLYFMYDPKCSTAFSLCTINVPATFAWCTTHFVHKMELSYYDDVIKTFSALLAICAGNSPVTGEFPAQRPVTRSFDVFFDLCLNKRLSKHWQGWWIETPSRPLWRHSNA